MILVLAAETYFICEFLTRRNFYNRYSEFMKSYKAVNEEDISYMKTLDVYREYYANPQNTYGRTEPLSSIVSEYWMNLYLYNRDYITVVLYILV